MSGVNVRGLGSAGALECEEDFEDGQSFEALDEDGLSDPEGRGHFSERGVGLVGELRQEKVVKGTRGITDGAKDAEGDWKEVAGGREVLADGVVLVLLAVEGGGVRSFAGLGELRLDKRIGNSEVEMQLLSRVARDAIGERDVGTPCGIAVGLSHGDGGLLGEGNVSLVEGSTGEVADSVVDLYDSTTLLAGANVIAVGVEWRVLRRAPLQTEGAVGGVVVLVEVEERGTEVALHGDLEERREEVKAHASIGEGSLPGVGFTRLQLDKEGVEALIGDSEQLGEDGVVNELGEGGLGDGLVGSEGELLARRENAVEGDEGSLTVTLEEIDSSGEEFEDLLAVGDEASKVGCGGVEEGVAETKATHGDGERGEVPHALVSALTHGRGEDRANDLVVLD